MKKDTTYVALDDSKRVIVAAILRAGEQDPEVRQLPNDSRLIRRRSRLIGPRLQPPQEEQYEAWRQKPLTAGLPYQVEGSPRATE